MAAPRPTRTAEGDPLTAPAYDFRDAAKLVRVPASTVRAWCRGQGKRSSDGKRSFEPVIAIDDAEGRFLSFRNLVELHVLAAIRRQYGVSLQKTRRAVAFMKEHLGGDHPLASHRMLTDGRDLLVREGDRLLNVSRSGQLEMDAVSAFLDRIEFDRRGVLVRLYPFPTTSIHDTPRSVVVDPRLQFGRPCLLGTGIPTEVVAERFLAGETIDAIAVDYEIGREHVEAAIRFEQVAAA